jgi:hypothetical protein
MASIAYAAPPVEALATARMPQGMRMTWESWDGTIWNIADGSEGVALMPGVRGLNMPPTRRHTQTSPAVHGSRRTGWIASEREVYWPTLVYKPIGEPDWADLDGDFWRSMHPDKPGIWSVTDPTGITRKLTCVYDSDGGHTTNILPSITGWEKYGIYLAAEQPFWVGETLRRGWSGSGGTSFFGSGAPNFNISTASSASTATVGNPGDLDAWPEWTIVGPSTTTTIGRPGRLIQVPFNVPAGKALIVDTDPSRQTVLYGDWVPDALTGFGYLNNPTSRFSDMGAIDFAPVPAGEAVPLSIVINGSGVVLMKLTPRHFRAWGK